MKAAYFQRYGDVDVLEIGHLPEPTLKPHHVMVNVRAAAINPKDTFIRKGRFKRFTGNRFPQLIGFDFAGEVVESTVGAYQRGMRVYGMLEGWHGGTCAGFVCVQAHQLAPIPDTLSYTDAAALPLVTVTALQALRDEAQIAAGQQICINGASGGVGSMAVQIAKLYDCHVTAIASRQNHDFLYGLGADTCLDYRETDIQQSQQTFDIFFDVFGNTRFKQIAPILTERGVWVSTVLRRHVLISRMLTLLQRKRARLVVVKAVQDDLSQIAKWVSEERLHPIIHKVYPLEAIAEAQQQQQSKHTRGKLVITI